MQHSRILLTALTVGMALAIGSVRAQSAHSVATRKALADAKITMNEARRMALKAAPGKVIDEEFEKEGGAWRYSFDIREADGIHEVGISARTGNIVENSYEGRQDKD